MWEGELKIPNGGVDRVPRDLVFEILMAILGKQNRYYISETWRNLLIYHGYKLL